MFLVDGTSNGLLTAEIINWTGHVLTGPCSKLSELVQRPECARTGEAFMLDLNASVFPDTLPGTGITKPASW